MEVSGGAECGYSKRGATEFEFIVVFPICPAHRTLQEYLSFDPLLMRAFSPLHSLVCVLAHYTGLSDNVR